MWFFMDLITRRVTLIQTMRRTKEDMKTALQVLKKTQPQQMTYLEADLQWVGPLLKEAASKRYDRVT